MKRILALALIALFFWGGLEAGLKHKRDGTYLPKKEQEFSESLSLRQRKVFCGQFTPKQRQAALRYARGRGHDLCFTPDEAVTKVMEEDGMSLASKGKPEHEGDRE